MLVFILPPSLAEPRQRLIRRNKASMAAITRRLKQIEQEMRYIPRYDRIIINKDLALTIKSLQKIVKNE